MNTPENTPADEGCARATGSAAYVEWKGKLLHRSRLTTRQIEAYEAIMSTPTLVAAAKKLGIGTKTLNWHRTALNWKAESFGISPNISVEDRP